jgi:hypothetical protein
MTIRVVRLGTPRAAGEGLRIGTVRRPPRGVPRAQFASGNWYDVWLPLLAPSAATVKLGLGGRVAVPPIGAARAVARARRRGALMTRGGRRGYACALSLRHRTTP